MNGAEDSTYSTEVPSFKEIGTHTVDYKITSTNYEDLTGTFDVQVQKMDLANAYVGFTNTPQIYNGSAIDPGVTVKGTETSTDAISASEYTVAYRRTKDAAGNTVTEDTVSAPENAGTYDVIVTAKSGSAFVTGTKTVTDGITIQPKPFTDNQGNVAVSVLVMPEYFTYNTEEHQVEDGDIKVTDTARNVTLTQETDYTITRPGTEIQAAGEYTFTFNGTGNYKGSCTKKIEVRKADLTNAEVEINGTYTYSGEAQEPGKGDTTQVQITLDNIPVDLSEYMLEYANNTVAAEASSNTAPKVTVKAIADGNYTGTVSKTFTILRKPLTVTAENKQVTYKEDAPVFTAVYDGFVNGETLEKVGGTIKFRCEYENGSSVGDYEIQPEVTGLANYEVTANKGTLSVLPRTPEFMDSANLYATRVYDGKAVDLAPTTDGDGKMSCEITNRETNEVLTFDPVDVGKYHVVYSVSEGKNYTEGSVSYDFAITQAPLVITAEDKKVTFGSKAPEYTVVYDGFVNGETDAVLTGTLIVTCDYTVESRESAYEIVPSGLSAKNYAIAWKNGVLTARYPESDSDDYEETSKPANSKMPKSGTTKDAKKGYVNENSGIISGKTLTEEMLTNNSESLNDGYSHWIQTNAGWCFRYADGSYPKAAGAANSGSGNSSAAQSYEWVQIDGNWWSFDSNGYLGTRWIFDPVYRNWFYMDVNTGMKTGWVQINGKWYYFNPVSDGTKGIMFANRMTPDGWFVREDGSWDEKR